MPMGMIFWMLMILWFLFSVYASRADLQGGRFVTFGGQVLLFILLFLVGWKIFGFVVQ